MKSLELFWIIMKRTYADKFLAGFLIYFLISCILILFLDPNIKTFGDALWFGFNVTTSIGLGDYTVTSAGARIVTALLGLYAALILSFVPGIMTTYYMERVKLDRNESITKFLYQLEHLDQLSNDELKQLSSQVTKTANQNHLRKSASSQSGNTKS